VRQPVRIGVDARELAGASTGVGRYVGELLRRWTGRADAGSRQFLLYAPVPLTLELPGPVTQRVVGSGSGTRWEQIDLRRAVQADRPDVFFAPAYTAPLQLPCPLVVTIHDVSFAAHPEWFRRVEGARRRFVTRRTARRAAAVLTDSRFSQGEIAARLGVPAERIRVISPGTGLPVAQADEPSRRDPLVLYVGTLFNRRRLPDLIAAFAAATSDRPESRLVIVGVNRTWPPQDLEDEARRLGVAERVRIADYVADAELADLYARASVFAFFSEYEGFGLTPLEALSAGVPPVVFDTPVAREVYGAAAVFVPPGDPAAQAAALRRLLFDAGARDAVLSNAPAVLSRYSWDAAAEATLAAIEGAIRR
jgi:glycosyltransferase involved in cell wall biosynthesis